MEHGFRKCRLLAFGAALISLGSACGAPTTNNQALPEVGPPSAINDPATATRLAERWPKPDPATTTTTVAVPDAFPTAATAGVPQGTTLRAWPWKSYTSDATGVPTETHAGLRCQVFDRYLVSMSGNQQLEIDSPCVVFRRSRFIATGDVGRVVSQMRENRLIIIESSDFDGGPYHNRGIQGDYADISIDRSEFRRFGEAAAEMNNRSGTAKLTVTRSYLQQDAGWVRGQHVDGVQMAAGGGLLVRGNTILIQPFGGSTDDYSYVSNSTVGTGTTLGDIGAVEIDGNLLAGGGRLIYVQSKGYRWTGSVRITNNVFDQRFTPVGAIWGPIYPDGIPDQLVWSGNRWGNGKSVSLEEALAVSP